CETIPCLDEAVALAALLAQFPHVPAWLSFSCRDQGHVCHGETLAECVAAVEHVPNIVAVGVNCTAPRHVRALLESLAGKTAKLLLTSPNSGETWDADSRSWRASADDVDWLTAGRQWHQAGARLIGGCCRTTPDVIRALSALRSS